jgi:hypothetical protein
VSSVPPPPARAAQHAGADRGPEPGLQELLAVSKRRLEAKLCGMHLDALPGLRAGLEGLGVCAIAGGTQYAGTRAKPRTLAGLRAVVSAHLLVQCAPRATWCT